MRLTNKLRKPLPILLTLCVTLALLAGCANGSPNVIEIDFDKPAATADVPPESKVTAPENSSTVVPLNAVDSTIEYGDSTTLISNDGAFLAYISYPRALGFADETIERWAVGAYAEAQGELDEQLQDDPAAQGEINVQFDACFVDNRYVSILEKGMVGLSSMANPRDIVKTFNIDTEKNVFLESADILDFSKLDTVLALLRGQLLTQYPDAENALADISEEWLGHLLIGHEGIVVVLERSVYLPTYLGTQTVTLPYDKLGEALKLGKDTTPPEPPTPTDEPSAIAGEPPNATDAPPAMTGTNETPITPQTQPQNADIDPAKPMLALTFDDGPSKYTAHVLDLLEQYNSRATFFVVGNIVGNRPDVVARAYNMGCEIGGHSWSHRDLSKLSDADIRQEISDTADAVQAAIGIRPTFYRPPYGATGGAVKGVSAELGQAIVNWSVDTLDWKTKNADAVYNAVMNEAADKAIVLLHDLHGTTADAMDRVIPALIEQGYQLVTVSELMAYSGKAMEPGVVYYSGK